MGTKIEDCSVLIGASHLIAAPDNKGIKASLIIALFDGSREFCGPERPDLLVELAPLLRRTCHQQGSRPAYISDDHALGRVGRVLTGKDLSDASFHLLVQASAEVVGTCRDVVIFSWLVVNLGQRR